MGEAQSVQSVVKAVQVLKLLGDAPEGLSLQDLAGAMGQKPPGVHHLVQTLVAGGLVERTGPAVRYRIGVGVFDLVGKQTAHWLRREASVVLEGIVREAPLATALLAQVQEGDVVATLRMSPDRPGLVQRPSRQAMGVYGSASSLLFQAYWPAGVLKEFRERYLFEEYDSGWGSVEELEKFLALSRQRRYVAKPAGASGVVAVSAPVFGRDGQLLAGVGASQRMGPGEDRGLVEEKLVGLVLAGSRALEKALVF